MKTTYKKSFLTGIITCIVVIISFQSCVKDYLEAEGLAQTEWNPNLAIPLVYSSLTIEDILLNKDTNGLVSVGSDNFCTIIYKGNLFTYKGSDLINIPDQALPPVTSTLNTAQALALVPVGASVTVNNSQNVNFNPGTTSVLADSMVLKSGNLNIDISSDFKNNATIVISIPGAKKNGIAFSQTMNLTYGSSTPITANANVNLAGYHFDLTKGGSTSNQFLVNIDATFTGSGNTPLSSDKISFSMDMKNIKFEKLFGDIGQQQLSPNRDTVALSIFNNTLPNGNFSINDATVRVKISNSYGVPIQVSITQFDGYKPPSSAYPHWGYPTPYINIPNPSWTQIGQVKVDSFKLDKTNSNIVTVVNNMPNQLIYKINSTSNPSGSNHNNFVLDSSRLKVDLQVEIPLNGTAKDLELTDTMDFDFSEETDNVEWARIRTFNTNGFPLDVNFQVYFTDYSYTILDSVFKAQPVLKSGTLNSAGKVISPVSSTNDALYTNAQINNLKNVKFLIIRAKANTSGGGNTPVKIYSDYKLDVKIAIQVQAKIKF